MTKFEEVLHQYEPMISATLRKLHIYRDHEQFRQAARVSLWQAWQRYDAEKGHFAPFAARSIRGAMLDVLKRENHFGERMIQTEDDLLTGYIERKSLGAISNDWSESISYAIETLSQNEKNLIHWIYVEGLTQLECAEKANLSKSGIKKRRERLLVKLKEQLLKDDIR